MKRFCWILLDVLKKNSGTNIDYEYQKFNDSTDSSHQIVSIAYQFTSLNIGGVLVRLPEGLAKGGQVPQEAVHLRLARAHLLQGQLDQLLGRRRVGRLPGEDGQDRLGDHLALAASGHNV